MKALFFILLTAVAWVLIGIWTYNWFEPNGFIQVVVWLMIWQFIAGIVGAVLSFLGAFGDN